MLTKNDFISKNFSLPLPSGVNNQQFYFEVCTMNEAQTNKTEWGR